MSVERNVLVTGAAGGMGLAHALVLAERGYRVVATDLEVPSETVAEVTAIGGSAVGVELDVASEDGWRRIGEQLAGHRLVGLVNNAGINFRGGIQATGLEAWERVMRVNLTGAFLGMRSLAPLIASSGGGSIVNVSSGAALTGYHNAAYGASKWGLRGLTKTAAGEYAAWGVRVNSVHPGLIDTPLLYGADAYVDSHLRSIPSGEIGQPRDVAELVAFLVSEESGYISGAEIAVDGGFTAMGTYGRVSLEAQALSPYAPTHNLTTSTARTTSRRKP